MNKEKLTDWRDAIQMPIIAPRPKGWKLDLEEMEKVLTKSICFCAKTCLEKNKGRIALTLSGGIDSSFCLWAIRKNFPLSLIKTFTIGESESHPDILFAREIAKICMTEHLEFIPTKDQIKKAKNAVASFWPKEQEKLGSVAVFMTYRLMAENGIVSAISHDGIDEQLGGYWDHRKYDNPKEKKRAFVRLWDRLEADHLLPLENKSKHFGIEVILPYIQKNVVSYISNIPINKRTSHEVSKIPLRIIASKYLPRGIIERPKKGFCDALNKV